MDNEIVFDNKKDYDDFIARINGTYQYTEEEINEVKKVAERFKEAKRRIGKVKIIVR